MTDHKAEAERLLNHQGDRWSNNERNDPHGAAQVHATLYLAEQQRIANLLTWASVMGLNDKNIAKIRAALGMDA